MVRARRWAIRAVLVLVVLLVMLGAAAWWFVVPSGPDEPDLSGSLTQHTTTSGDRARTWSSYASADVGPDAPVVLVLHGSLQDGAAMRRTTAYRFDRLADRHGFVVVYPDGVDDNWNECRRGGDFTAKREGVDDVAFLRDVVAELDATGGGVDATRVFATGYSSGGQMALRLAREAPDLVAGVAPVAAGVPTPDNSSCTDLGEPVPALFVAGTDDPMNPYDGGEVALRGFASRGEVLSALDGAAGFARRNGTTADPTASDLPERDGDDGTGATRLTWPGQAQVQLVTIVAGGHQYPAPGYRGPRFLGPSATDVDAPATVAAFFGLVPGGS